MTRTILVVLTAVFIAAAAFADFTVKPAFSRDAVGVKAYAAAPRVAERAAIEPAVTVAPAAEAALDEILALQKWNDNNNLPLQDGFTRSIGDPISVRLEGAVAAKSGELASHARGLVSATERGTLVWSGAVRVEGAHLVRLHLTNVRVPDDATFWVWGPGQEPIAFGKELVYEGNLYTPSARGPVIHLEIEIPSPKVAAGGASFDIKDFIEILADGALRTPTPQDVPSCLIDANCVSASTFDEIASARAAIGHLRFVKSGGTFICSGGLLNDTVTSSFIPYLLTANHCFNTQAVATTLEVHWDFKTTSCNAATTTENAQLSNGSTHLASSDNTDFTLVRLNSVPGSRVFLGWTTTAVATSAQLHRVSHPMPDFDNIIRAQRYSNTNENSVFGTCSGRPLSHYLYSNGGQGGTYGGSSGSPVILAGGYIVGQLLGACGPPSTNTNGCDNVNNASIDGRFAQTYPSISSYLDPTPTGTCTPSSTNICLKNDRFGVSITYRTSGGQSGTAGADEYTADSGLFYFFAADNIEVLLKVLNGCGLNNRYWVFSAATTDVEYTITVTDTQTGSVKTYFHALGTPAATILDTGAFATCP